MTLLWVSMAVMTIAGLIIGFTVSKVTGVILVTVGCAGYLISGIVIYATVPRR